MINPLFRKILFFLLIAPLFLSVSAYAYIPPYWLILSNTAENHGKGAYFIDQDVVFNHGETPITINERWTLIGENSLRLEMTGRKQMKDKIRLTIIYQNSKKYFIDENGVKKSEMISKDFSEPYFHFRFSKNIKPMLVAQSIAPAASLKNEAHRYSAKTPTPEAEDYVRLSRVGGTVAYAIGTPTPTSSDANYPGLWIEQDQFVIRKLRLSSQVEIVANQYKTFSQGLKLPVLRGLSWSGGSATITVNNVVSLPLSTKTKDLLEHSSLDFGANPNLSRQLPEDPVLRDFYSRMR